MYELEVRRVLLHEDNQAVVSIPNAIVSAWRPIMAELQKLASLLKGMGLQIEARRIPSAVKRFANSLPRTWDPRDV